MALLSASLLLADEAPQKPSFSLTDAKQKWFGSIETGGPKLRMLIEVEIKEDGTIDRCLHCGEALARASVSAPWLKLIALALIGLGLAPFTFGVSALLVAYPAWFLWKDAPRTQHCDSCGGNRCYRELRQVSFCMSYSKPNERQAQQVDMNNMRSETPSFLSFA
ncbi:MAG: hypothetical protein AAGF97_13380, partial [Planctomycetota bacterium]